MPCRRLSWLAVLLLVAPLMAQGTAGSGWCRRDASLPPPEFLSLWAAADAVVEVEPSSLARVARAHGQVLTGTVAIQRVFKGPYRPGERIAIECPDLFGAQPEAAVAVPRLILFLPNRWLTTVTASGALPIRDPAQLLAIVTAAEADRLRALADAEHAGKPWPCLDASPSGPDDEALLAVVHPIDRARGRLHFAPYVSGFGREGASARVLHQDLQQIAECVSAAQRALGGTDPAALRRWIEALPEPRQGAFIGSYGTLGAEVRRAWATRSDPDAYAVWIDGLRDALADSAVRDAIASNDPGRIRAIFQHAAAATGATLARWLRHLDGSQWVHICHHGAVPLPTLAAWIAGRDRVRALREPRPGAGDGAAISDDDLVMLMWQDATGLEPLVRRLARSRYGQPPLMATAAIAAALLHLGTTPDFARFAEELSESLLVAQFHDLAGGEMEPGIRTLAYGIDRLPRLGSLLLDERLIDGLLKASPQTQWAYTRVLARVAGTAARIRMIDLAATWPAGKDDPVQDLLTAAWFEYAGLPEAVAERFATLIADPGDAARHALASLLSGNRRALPAPIVTALIGVLDRADPGWIPEQIAGCLARSPDAAALRAARRWAEADPAGRQRRLFDAIGRSQTADGVLRWAAAAIDLPDQDLARSAANLLMMQLLSRLDVWDPPDDPLAAIRALRQRFPDCLDPAAWPRRGDQGW